MMDDEILLLRKRYYIKGRVSYEGVGRYFLFLSGFQLKK